MEAVGGGGEAVRGGEGWSNSCRTPGTISCSNCATCLAATLLLCTTHSFTQTEHCLGMALTQIDLAVNTDMKCTVQHLHNTSGHWVTRAKLPAINISMRWLTAHLQCTIQQAYNLLTFGH